MEGNVEAVLRTRVGHLEYLRVVRMSCGLVKKEVATLLVELVFEFPYCADSQDNHTGLVANGDSDKACCSLRLLVTNYTETRDG